MEHVNGIILIYATEVFKFSFVPNTAFYFLSLILLLPHYPQSLKLWKKTAV